MYNNSNDKIKNPLTIQVVPLMIDDYEPELANLNEVDYYILTNGVSTD